MLEMFKKVFKNSNSKTTGLRNLLLDPGIAKLLQQKESSIQKVISVAALNSYPASGLMSALDYFNAYRRKLLPTNLVQAQRDFFGAHTYQRIDGEGIFHTKWEEKK
jgi:6-phosphogluconate dehydrogenase